MNQKELTGKNNKKRFNRERIINKKTKNNEKSDNSIVRKRIIIIGAGASGLMASIAAARTASAAVAGIASAAAAGTANATASATAAAEANATAAEAANTTAAAEANANATANATAAAVETASAAVAGTANATAAEAAARKKISEHSPALADIILLDSNSEPGEKLLATGNGRCNFTNTNCSTNSFMSTDPEFSKHVYGTFDVNDTIDFFREIGVLPRVESEGRVYPYSGQAVSVRAALVREAERLGVRIITDVTVSEIDTQSVTGASTDSEDFKEKNSIKNREKRNSRFLIKTVSGEELYAESVIIAAGGRAGLQFGSTGDGYGFAKKTGHTLISPRPALVPLVSEEKYFKEIKGVRARAHVELISRGKALASDIGEVQFTSYGLSGICIFNLSRYMTRDAAGTIVKIDLAPDMKENDLSAFILHQIQNMEARSPKEDIDTVFGEYLEAAVLSGIINVKLIPVVSHLASERLSMGSMSDRHTSDSGVLAAAFAHQIKCWDIPVSGTKGWKEAQTTCGGIDTLNIFHETLESKVVNGLYFCGEVLDVDGLCGGFNLQWAWSSGHLAGTSCAEALIE